VDYNFTAVGTSSGQMGSSLPSGGGIRPSHPHGASYVSLLCVQYVDFLTDSIT